jgi:hypothetical protein
MEKPEETEDQNPEAVHLRLLPLPVDIDLQNALHFRDLIVRSGRAFPPGAPVRGLRLEPAVSEPALSGGSGGIPLELGRVEIGENEEDLADENGGRLRERVEELLSGYFLLVL